MQGVVKVNHYGFGGSAKWAPSGIWATIAAGSSQFQTTGDAGGYQIALHSLPASAQSSTANPSSALRKLFGKR
jgi:hypothetical protein